MGWGNARLNEAAAVCAAQLPAIGLIWWIGNLLGDDYAYAGAFGFLSSSSWRASSSWRR